MKRVAIVTGASRGLGEAIALALLEANYNVGVGYNTQKEMAEKVCSYHDDNYPFNEREVLNIGEGIPIELNVNNRASIKDAYDTIIDGWGRIDILINNAAISQEKQYLHLTDWDFQHMLSVNLVGPSACSQLVLPHMISNGGGRIINITSIGGQKGGVNQVHYAASKAGLISLTKSLSNLYAQYGVLVNAVAPGLVSSGMSSRELDTVEGHKKVVESPLGRIATPEEIAHVVKVLCSSKMSYMTGQTINVNGGSYCG